MFFNINRRPLERDTFLEKICSVNRSTIIDNKTLCKEILRWLIFIILFLKSTSIFAAPPPLGMCDNYKKIKGPKLTVTWDILMVPQAVGWQGATTFTKVSPKARSIKIKRVGYQNIPSQLIVVPRDTSFQPKILEVSSNQMEVHFSTEKIKPNEIWFWGGLSKSPCPGTCGGPWPYGLDLRFVNGSHFASLTGMFLKKLQKTSSPQYLLSTSHHGLGKIRRISIESFQKPDKTMINVCSAMNHAKCNSWKRKKNGKYIRDEEYIQKCLTESSAMDKDCKNMLGPTEKSWGHSAEVKTQIKYGKWPCPI